MAEMRAEFEQYVKEMVTAISKDIFLDRLETACKELSQSSTEYNESSNKISELSSKMIKEVYDISQGCENVVNRLDDDVDYIKKHTKSLFDELSKQELKKKQELLAEIVQTIETQRDGVRDELARVCDGIEEVLETGGEDIEEKIESNKLSIQSLLETGNSSIKKTLETGQNNIDEILKNNDSNLENTLKCGNNSIKKALDTAEGDIGSLFNDGSKDIRRLLETGNTNIEKSLQNGNNTLKLILDSENDKIKNIIENVISASQAELIIEELEKNTEAAKEFSSYVTNAYKVEIENSIKNIIENISEDQKEISEAIERHLKETLEKLESGKNKEMAVMNRFSSGFLEALIKESNETVASLKNALESDRNKRQQQIEYQNENIAKYIKSYSEDLKTGAETIDKLLKDLAEEEKVSRQNQINEQREYISKYTKEYNNNLRAMSESIKKMLEDLYKEDNASRQRQIDEQKIMISQIEPQTDKVHKIVSQIESMKNFNEQGIKYIAATIAKNKQELEDEERKRLAELQMMRDRLGMMQDKLEASELKISRISISNIGLVFLFSIFIIFGYEVPQAFAICAAGLALFGIFGGRDIVKKLINKNTDYLPKK